MLTKSDTELQTLIRTGHFATALRQLTARRLDASRDENNVTLLELLERTGQTGRAVDLAKTITLSGQLSDYLRARVEMVLGLLARYGGNLRASQEHFQRAILAGANSGDLASVAWAQLRLMAAIAEDLGPEAANSHRATIRTTVARVGDAHLTAAMHVFLAELEGRKGLMDAAHHHIQIGLHILEQYPNVWLEGLANNTYSLIYFYMSADFAAAIRTAERAIDLAETSGHRRTTIHALTNLGNLFLSLGEVKKAWNYLEQGLAMVGEMADARIFLLNTCAEAKLALRDWRACEELLEDKRVRHRERNVSQPDWQERWSVETRIRLLQQQARWPEALALSTTGVNLVTKAGESLLTEQFSLLRALSSAALGSVKETADLLTQVRGHRSLNFKAQLWRLQGVASASVGEAAGRQLFERSISSLATIGDACGRADAIENYAAAIWRALGHAPVVHGAGDSPLAGVSRKPRRITYHPDHASHLLPKGEFSSAEAIESVATLRELASHPEALGHEVFELLLRTGCTAQAAFLTRSAQRVEQVLALHGAAYERDGRLPASLRGAMVLALGKAHTREFEILAHARPDLSSQITLIAIAKLLADALALEKAQREERERASLWPLDALDEAEHGVFAASNMVELAELARRIAANPVTVLITGETGTGKEVLARLVHARSPRASRPFIPFNCGSVPKDMLDSQLFGHRRGAFTGAVESFPGVIRTAAGGTLFLDEIAELSPDVQPKLLRFLDSKEIHPLGETKAVTVDVRIIAATNAKLEQAVAEGRFREDLFYRLNIMRLSVPPLRERREEIPLLVEHFLRRYSTECEKANLRVSEETMEYLLLYKWPGNVRQLSNEINRVVALAENGAVITPEHLDKAVTAGRRTVPVSARSLTPLEIVVRLDQPLAAATEHLERSILQHALTASKGHAENAAKLLGLSRKGLYLKRQRLKL